MLYCRDHNDASEYYVSTEKPSFYDYDAVVEYSQSPPRGNQKSLTSLKMMASSTQTPRILLVRYKNIRNVMLVGMANKIKVPHI